MSEQWNLYENAATGLTLEYPPPWSYEEDLSIGGVIFAHDVIITGQETDPFAPVVNILSHRNPDTTLDDYTQQQIVRLRQMTMGNPSDLKIDRSASLAGYPAHRAICTIPVDPIRAIRLYSIWTRVNDWIYLVHFTCDILEFSRHQRVVMRMLNSMKVTTPKPKTVLFTGVVDPNQEFCLRYPSSFGTTRSSSGSKPSSPKLPPNRMKIRLAPALNVKDSFQGQNKTEYIRSITLVVHRRQATPAAEPGELLAREVQLLLDQLEQLRVEKVVWSRFQVGPFEGKLLEYDCSAVHRNAWYQQLIVVRPHSTTKPTETIATIATQGSAIETATPSEENGAPTEPTAAVPEEEQISQPEPPKEMEYSTTILTMSSTGPRDDDYTIGLFNKTALSLRLGLDEISMAEPGNKHPDWCQWEHLLLGFGIEFDPEKYVCKDSGIPFAEALFVHRDDLLDKTIPDDATTFSIVVRQVPQDSKVNLTEIGDDIIANLARVYNVEVLQAEDCLLNGRSSRLIVSRGASNSSGENQEMYFAHKLVVNEEAGVAVWFAFAATAENWKPEWANVDTYISSLYWL